MVKNQKIIASVYPFPFSIGMGHNTNFTLIKGDEIFSSEEGKINGIINSSSDRFPEKSMLSAFKHFNINPQDIDHWVFGNPVHTPPKPALKFFFSKFKSKSYEELSKKKCISYIKHHLAHASLGIYGSGYDSGMFVCMDDGGDEADPFDTMWGTFEKNSIKILGRYNNGGWGITRFHNFICESIGYLGNVDNGKVMGLAAYGQVKVSLYKEFKKLLKISKDGFSAQFLLRHNPKKSKPRFDKLKLDAYEYYKVINSSNPPKELKKITKYYSSLDIAATGQQVVEDVALEVVTNMLKHTKKKKLVCSGGFFQNISFNKRLLDLNLGGVYVPSAPNDSGLSLGGALFHKMSVSNKRPKKTLSSYLGPKFGNKEIEDIIDEFKLSYKKSDDVCVETAKLLNDGKIIGWFQGRSELGPRSLGARSVLADPRNLQNKAKINQLLKKRDWFMPYAPSILYDKMDFFYDKYVECPYMSFSMNITKNFNKVPAAVHVDKSSRPHTIKKEELPRYYNLINEFYKLTGIPAVLNTSFNRHGVATIQTPRQAIEHLLNGCVEILVMEDFIIFANKKDEEKKEKLYSEEYYLLVEKIRHIIDAMINKDKNISKIIEENKKILTTNNIVFDLKNKELVIDQNKIKFKDSERKNIRSKLFPLFDKKEKIFFD